MLERLVFTLYELLAVSLRDKRLFAWPCNMLADMFSRYCLEIFLGFLYFTTNAVALYDNRNIQYWGCGSGGPHDTYLF